MAYHANGNSYAVAPLDNNPNIHGVTHSATGQICAEVTDESIHYYDRHYNIIGTETPEDLSSLSWQDRINHIANYLKNY